MLNLQLLCSVPLKQETAFPLLTMLKSRNNIKQEFQTVTTSNH
jgi:hypothetical protein